MKILQHVFDDVLRHCMSAAPEEACGVLAGRPDGSLATVGQRLANVAEFPRERFELDEVQQVMVWHRLADQNKRVLVIYHSHPRHGAELSDTDVRYAAVDPSILHMVVSLRDDNAGLWRVSSGNVVEAVPWELTT